MPDPAAKPTRRYAAFVSYRHSDNLEDGRRWAEWLHQSLETYEVPRDLAGKPNLRGVPVPTALYPVFRDEEELSADADLSQNLRRALENTEVLIVLCSPRASESPFVAEEIRYFKELGKSDRILALMIDGEPNADDPAKAAQGITPAMECFPEPLRFGVSVTGAAGGPARIDWTQHTEPLAADVRPQNRAGQGYTSGHAYRAALEKEGKRSHAEIRRMEKEFAAQLDLARLKLVAGALGLPLGQLRERDAVYRAKKFRRLAAILGSLALLALIAAGAAVWQGIVAKQQQIRAVAGEKAAVAARERAVAAKNAADELIRFMQYDLRDTLGKLGALNMMDGINTRIRRYHEEHPPEPGDQDAQDSADRERGVALEQQGNILLARGQLAEALKSYQEELTITKQLSSRYPESTRVRSDLAAGFGHIAQVQKAQGDLAASLKSYQDSLAISRQLVAQVPDDAGRQYDLSIALDNVGDVQKARGDLPSALQSYLESLNIRLKLTEREPDETRYREGLATALSKIGDALEAKGDLPSALQNYQESLAISRKLAVQDPANTKWQRDLSVSLDKVANIQRAKHDLPGALQNYQESLAIRQKLATHDPANAGWQRDLSISYSKVGSVQKVQGDWAAALQSYRESVAVCQKLAAQDPANTDWQHDLSACFANIGDVQEKQKDLPAALQSDRDSLAILQKLAAQDPANADWQRDLASGLDNLGSVQETQKDLPAALQSYQDSLAILQKLAARDPANTGWQLGAAYGERDVGLVLVLQGQKEKAGSHFERFRQVVDRLISKHPGSYNIQICRVSARTHLAECVDPQTPAGREEARRQLGESIEILRGLEKSPGLKSGDAKWLGEIEADLEKMN